MTEVDHLCEALVMEAVRRRYPGDRFYAEEIGEVAAAGEIASGRVWIVDPLDGTVNYANGIPFFCISIALVADGRPVVGVVYDPTRDETFVGRDRWARPCGTACRSESAPRSVWRTSS